jgi:hypothetical protein
VSDFGVKLNPVQKPVAALHRRVSDGRGLGKTDKIFWQGEDTIAVAHPDIFGGIEALKERICLKDLQGAGAILPLLAAGYLAAQIMGHQLHPIADPQDRDLQLIDASIDPGGIGSIDARWSSREDQTPWGDSANLFDRDVPGDDLGIDPQLAHTLWQ